MNALEVARLVMRLLVALAPRLIDLIERGVAGDDISADEVWRNIPHETRALAEAEIMAEKRRRLGLPV